MSLESLYWELEPSSSSPGPDSSSEWFVQDYPRDDASSPVAVVPSRADVAQQLLDDLEEYVTEEESFSNWFDEEKAILPPLEIFNDLQVVSATSVLPASAELTSLINVTHPSYVKEEASFGHGHLTPPQSPPQGPLLPLQSSPAPVSYATLEVCQSEYPGEYLPDVAREMAVVDEVVRGVAQEWEYVEYTDSTSRSSDSTSIDESDDPEWQPVVAAAAAKPAGRAARRSRPYNQQDRRQRKKEQNKTAATRYRMKKKAEVSTIVDEERVLAEKNTNLRDKVVDIEKEISYLKNLMREMFRAKGLVK